MSAPGPARAAEDTRADWETPAELFGPLNDEFRFELDAAASVLNKKAFDWLGGPCTPPLGEWDGACGCGLCADWGDRVVWCNPPFGKGLDKWVEKFASAKYHGATVVALLPANTDTKWFRTVWWTATEIRFLSKRVQFVGSTSSNPCGSMIAIYRPDGLPTGNPHVRLWDWRK